MELVARSEAVRDSAADLLTRRLSTHAIAAVVTIDGQPLPSRLPVGGWAQLRSDHRVLATHDLADPRIVRRFAEGAASGSRSGQSGEAAWTTRR